MRRETLIVIAGGSLSFVVVFFVTALAMGLLKDGPGPVIAVLAGRSPGPAAAVVEEQSAGAVAGAKHASPAEAPSSASPRSDSTVTEETAPSIPAPAASEPAVAPPTFLPGDQLKPQEAPEDSFLPRAEALTRIEAALQQRQQEVDAEKAELAALRAQLEASQSHMDSLHAAGVQQIARIYDSMRPEAAADILARLPAQLQTEIVGHMDERVAAKVLGAMDRRVAARISASLGRNAPTTQPSRTGGTAGGTK